MQATKCPPRNRLKAYLTGRLDEQDSDVLEQHLLECVECEQAASALDHDPDTLVELLQHGPTTFAKPNSLEPPARVESPLMLAAIPSVIASYELLKQLGNGGMGAVYLARHKKLDKQVAIKLLPALPAKMPEFVARFQREMRAAGQLDHPAIVRSTDAGEENGVHFLVMDAIDGLDLSRIARTQSPLSIADACEVARQAALGLSHAHEKGIVHRDIKPSNLMLDVDGQVKILDFGLAQVGLWDSGSAEITTVGQLMGTLDYMAPEQAERGGAVDYRADLYSLGATLFRLLTGRAPLAAAPDLTPLEKLRLLSTHKPPKLATLRTDVPAELSQLLDSFLSREPTLRPASAAHAAELLEPFCHGAELASLVARAKAIPTDDESPSRPPIASLLHPGLQQQKVPANSSAALLTSSQHHVVNQRRGWGRSWGRVLTWSMLALGLGMFCAGILVVLETSQGQLVIESENAELQVKLLKEGEATTELHIEPGVQTTRLRGGKYEIVIDAPSDNFTVSNQQFTIRNGETIVAKISSKPAIAKSATPTQLAHPAMLPTSQTTRSDKRLESVVYEGDSLDIWLRRLKFERSDEKVLQALDAIACMSDENVSDLVESSILEFLMNSQMSATHWRNAISILKKASGERFFENAAKILSNQSIGNERRDGLLNAFGQELSSSSLSDVGKLSKFLQWATAILHNDSPATKALQASVANILKHMLEDPGSTRVFSVQCQQAVLDVLLSSKQLTNAEFWLAQNEGALAYQADVTWYAILRNEIGQRAIAVLGDTNADVQLVAQAGLVLTSIRGIATELSSGQRVELIAALQWRLARAAKNLDSALKPISVSKSHITTAFPILLYENSHSERGALVNEAMVLMNVVFKFELRDPLREPLTALHESVASQPLHGNRIEELLVKGQRILWGNWIYDMRSQTNGEKIFLQTAFAQSGLLIGKDSNSLLARFNQKGSADLAAEVEEVFDSLETSPENQAYFSILYQRVTREHAKRAIPFLRMQLEQRDFYVEVLPMLWRVSGDQFFVHFAKAIEGASQEKRELLLSTDFSEQREFGCSDPTSLTALLKWSDSIFASEREADVALQLPLAKMLRSLLRDRTETVDEQRKNRANFEMQGELVSPECQQLILSHLQNYTQLTNENFWFNEPAKFYFPAEAEKYGAPMDVAFRHVMLQRALTALSPSTETLTNRDQLRTHALMAIRSLVGAGEQLKPEQRDELKSRLSELLVDAARDLQECSVEQWGPFGYWAIPNVPFTDSASDFKGPCNLLTVGLSLIDELKMASELTGRIQSLFEVAQKPRITTNYYGFKSGWADRRSYVPRLSVRDPYEFFIQTVYLQTGTLLGKDVNELVGRATKLKREDDEARRRLVQPGDTLAIYIPIVLPADDSPPPVIQAGKKQPVTGFPVPVTAEGEITLPHLDPLNVQGKDLNAVRTLLHQSYGSIVKPELLKGLTVQFLMRANEQIELRNVTGQAALNVDRRQE